MSSSFTFQQRWALLSLALLEALLSNTLHTRRAGTQRFRIHCHQYIIPVTRVKQDQLHSSNFYRINARHIPCVYYIMQYYTIWQSCPTDAIFISLSSLSLWVTQIKDFLWNYFVLRIKTGDGGLTDFTPLFIFFKHPLNTLQHPSNTLKTPFNTFQNHLFFSLKKWTENK